MLSSKAERFSVLCVYVCADIFVCVCQKLYTQSEIKIEKRRWGRRNVIRICLLQSMVTFPFLWMAWWRCALCSTSYTRTHNICTQPPDWWMNEFWNINFGMYVLKIVPIRIIIGWIQLLFFWRTCLIFFGCCFLSVYLVKYIRESKMLSRTTRRKTSEEGIRKREKPR